MSWRLGIDIGGTFTDFALSKGDEVILEKTLSTPEDRSLAVMSGIEQLAAREEMSVAALLGRLQSIVHGTTVADNTLIERTGAVTGLLTTEGFRDELELRRGYKEDIWDVRLPPPAPIVPRRRRLTVPERILHDGSVYQALDEAAARRALRQLAQQGVESLAICTLFSFVDPVHELRLGELAREELPEAEISLSHQVMPKAPEFERTSTAVVNAYIGPRVNGYLDRLSVRLREAGFQRELLVMLSSGGVMTREYVERAPVRVLASGPAGGVIGGAHAGLAKGEPDLLCVDMGGTSYDVSLVRRGMAPAEPGWNWHHRYVIGLPMVSVETLGAGGGSLCQVRHGGVLEVGPESAGADPGPVCYGRGGTRPTVTDANLVLGLLSDETTFAGGSFSLTRKGVADAFQEHVAGPLGCSVEQAARDCWRVINANMTQAVQRLTAEKGTDPRDLTLLAYGGNGPVFAAIQAQELGIRRVLVPGASPAFSALGALAAAPAIDEEHAYLSPVESADSEVLRRLWGELDDRAGRMLGAAFPGEERTTRFQLNLRYPGQNWSLTVDVAEARGEAEPRLPSAELLDDVVERFHALHEQEYGHRRAQEEPEITGVRLAASIPVVRPPFAGGFTRPRRELPVARTRRADLGDGFADVALFAGPELTAGDVVAAPAIIEERFTTIVVYPGWEARMDDAGDVILDRIGA